MASTRSAIIQSTLALVLAGFAFYPVVIPLAVFIAVASAEAWNRGDRVTPIAVGTLALIGAAFPIWAMRAVSVEGKALFGLRGSLGEAISVGLPPLLGENRRMAIFLFAALGGPLLAVPWLTKRTQILVAIFIVTAIGTYGIAAVSGRPFPIGRSLTPFVPIFLLASASACDDLAGSLRAATRSWVSVVVAPILAINAGLNYLPDDTHDWSYNKVDPIKIAKEFDGQCSSIGDPAAQHPAVVYYRMRAAIRMGLPCAAQTRAAWTLSSWKK